MIKASGQVRSPLREAEVNCWDVDGEVILFVLKILFWLSRDETLYFLFSCLLQIKYKEDGMRSLSQSVYCQLPETAETQLAKTVSELQSEVTSPRDFML